MAIVIIGSGTTVAFAAEKPVAAQRPTASAKPHGLPELTPETVRQYRASLALATAHPDARRSNLAKRTLLWLDIATAKTAAERSAKIRQLPVQVVVSAASDGRKGTVRTYIAGGKTRLQRFTPDTWASRAGVPPPAGSSDDAPAARGPASETGVWRYEGEFGCVWDEYGAGGDECTPVSVCETNGIIGECSTEAEQMDDDMVASAVEYEVEQYEIELAQRVADWDLYCANYPWYEGCGGEEEAPRGPSCTFAPCYQYAFSATQNAGITVVAVTGYRLTRQVQSLLAKKASKTMVGGAVIASFATGWYIGSFIDCMWLATDEQNAPLPVAMAHRSGPASAAVRFRVYHS